MSINEDSRQPFNLSNKEDDSDNKDENLLHIYKKFGKCLVYQSNSTSDDDTDEPDLEIISNTSNENTLESFNNDKVNAIDQNSTQNHNDISQQHFKSKIDEIKQEMCPIGRIGTLINDIEGDNESGYNSEFYFRCCC
jgi:hypothetical protein